MPSSTLEVGTPLFKKEMEVAASSTKLSDETFCIPPEQTGADCVVFVGVTIRGGEPVGAEMPIRRTGEALARVMGPVSVGDALGFSAGVDYLVLNGEPSVGTVEQDIAGATVSLVRVYLGGGSPAEAAASIPVWL